MLLAWLLYSFGLFSMGPVVVAFFAALLVMGWAVALGVTSLILRYGAGAEALAWSVLFGLTPFSAVFYPVSVLPAWLHPVAYSLPSAHVFEGMRAALLDGIDRLGASGRRLRAGCLLDGGDGLGVHAAVRVGPGARRAAEHRRVDRIVVLRESGRLPVGAALAVW